MSQIRNVIQYVMLSVIVIGLAAGTARAQAADPSALPPPDAMALVREVPGQIAGQGFLDGMRKKMLAGFGPRQNLPPEQVARMVNVILMPEFEAHFSELETTWAAIWASRFSPAEMADLLTYVRAYTPERQQQFVDSALGKKYIAQQADINRASGLAAREWGIRITLLAFARHADEVRSMGIDPDTGQDLPKPN